MNTTFDTDPTDKTLTLHITFTDSFAGPLSESFLGFIRDDDGDGVRHLASLTLWDPGTAKIAADDTNIAEDETTDFTVTLAGLRSTDSESRAVDHWPVRVDFPAGVAFTKNGQRLESDLYDIEISGNILAADIAVPANARNAIIISVRPAAIAARADEEAGKEVITYTFSPKPGAYAGMPTNVAVTLAALTGVTTEGTLTNSIYVPAAARELTFNIGERLGPLPDPTITAVSIDDDNNLEDDPTDTIAENGTIVVTVTLNTPIPMNVTDTMVTYVVEPRGTDAPVSTDDITAFTETQTLAGAEGSELTFSIEITEDNRIEFNEQGLVRITSVVWNGGADGVQSADSTAGFTIRDNDRIKISTPTMTVSENIGTFEYTVMATAMPVPDNAAGVVLDRDLTMSLNSVSVSASFGDDYTDIMTTTVVFPANTVAQTNLIGTPPAIPITIVNDGDIEREQFALSLSTNDTAVLIPAVIRIFIAPDPVSTFGGGAIVPLAESDGTPATRTLTVSRAPGGGSAIVSFGVSDGTVSTLDDSDHDFRLGVAAAPGVTDVTDLTVSNDNTSATFTIPADNFTGGVAGFTLTFTPIIDTDTRPERIAFSVTGIEFPGNPDYGVGAQLSSLTITVDESVAALTRPDGAASENDETGHFTVSLTDRLAGDAAIVAELSGNANFPGPQDADYGITVFPTGDRVSAIASDVTGSGNTRTLAFSMATGTDAVDVVVSPLADGYDEPQENVVLRLVSATFPAGAAAVDQPDPADRTVAIADHSDDVSDATLDKSGSLNEAGPVRGTFTLKLLHAPDENAAVAYAFATGDGFGILGTNYTVPITGAGVTTALTNAAGTFTIPRANIIGSGGSVEGSNPGEAVVTITVTPVNDDDAVSEDVTLTINTITFGDNISTHGDLVAAAICPAGSATCAAAGSQTLRIMDDDIAAAAYDSDAAITLTEGSGIGETRTLRLTNAPGTEAVATFTLAGGTTTGATDPDVIITVDGGADTLAFTDGTGGTFRIPPNDSNVTITFTPADNDDDVLDKVITFSITGIDFDNSNNDVSDPLPLTVNVNERPEATVSLAVISEMGGDPTIVEIDSNDGSGPDDTATITLTVGNVPAVATAVEITYTLTVGGFGASAADVSIAGASVGTGLTLTLDSLDRNAATASAVVVVTAQSDSDGDDEMVTFTVTRLSFTDAAFADLMGLTDSATILVDDNAGGICPRTRQVYQAILAQIISGDVSCANAIPRLGEVNTLTFTGLSSLQPGDFDDLDALAELNLSGSNDLRLPAGIFDDVLDTLTTLTIDDRLKGNLSFAGPSEIRQGGTVEITVQSSPAFVAVEATITVTFGGDEDAADFSGLSTQKITFGSNEAIKPIEVTAGDDATPEATATFAFGEIILIDGNGNPSALQTDSLIVPADPPDDTHTLTIKERALRLRIRTFLEGALQ